LGGRGLEVPSGETSTAKALDREGEEGRMS
jgi:hypothetical protein